MRAPRYRQLTPSPPVPAGRVVLVGAGPGDPELITLRGLRRLRRADTVVFDRLVHPDLLDEAPSHARRVDAGKAPGRPGLGQRRIEAFLVAEARRGALVVRLKGGDPFIFGRGGEEVAACLAAGVPCEVVPGVTSAVSAPAAAGIPLTHRGVAASFAVVTGHLAGARGPDWASFAAIDTLVVLMGVSRLPEIVEGLLEAGREATTPAALVERATLPGQRTLRSSLGELPRLAREARAGSPATLVIGEVVRLGEELAPWLSILEAEPASLAVHRPVAVGERVRSLPYFLESMP